MALCSAGWLTALGRVTYTASSRLALTEAAWLASGREADKR